MEIKYLKRIGLAYLIFAYIAIFLVEIGKISSFPILIGVTLFLLYFLVHAIGNLRITKKRDWVDFAFLWGIPFLISLQVMLLFDNAYQTYALAAFIIVMFSLWFLDFIYERLEGVSIFIFLLSLATASFSSAF
jgi:hypothetical protein